MDGPNLGEGRRSSGLELGSRGIERRIAACLPSEDHGMSQRETVAGAADRDLQIGAHGLQLVHGERARTAGL